MAQRRLVGRGLHAVTPAGWRLARSVAAPALWPSGARSILWGFPLAAVYDKRPEKSTQERSPARSPLILGVGRDVGQAASWTGCLLLLRGSRVAAIDGSHGRQPVGMRRQQLRAPRAIEAHRRGHEDIGFRSVSAALRGSGGKEPSPHGLAPVANLTRPVRGFERYPARRAGFGPRRPIAPHPDLAWARVHLRLSAVPSPWRGIVGRGWADGGERLRSESPVHGDDEVAPRLVHPRAVDSVGLVEDVLDGCRDL